MNCGFFLIDPEFFYGMHNFSHSFFAIKLVFVYSGGAGRTGPPPVTPLFPGPPFVGNFDGKREEGFRDGSPGFRGGRPGGPPDDRFVIRFILLYFCGLTSLAAAPSWFNSALNFQFNGIENSFYSVFQ